MNKVMRILGWHSKRHPHLLWLLAMLLIAVGWTWGAVDRRRSAEYRYHFACRQVSGGLPYEGMVLLSGPQGAYFGYPCSDGKGHYWPMRDNGGCYRVDRWER